MVIDGKLYSLTERMKHYNVQGFKCRRYRQLPGCVGQRVWVADKKEGRKVFEPGSISKSLNVVGILQLAQQGKLDLYQDINQYLG